MKFIKVILKKFFSSHLRKIVWKKNIVEDRNHD